MLSATCCVIHSEMIRSVIDGVVIIIRCQWAAA